MFYKVFYFLFIPPNKRKEQLALVIASLLVQGQRVEA